MTVVADSHPFDEVPDPHSHQSEKSNPCPHQSAQAEQGQNAADP
jgi:hypothetical protein